MTNDNKKNIFIIGLPGSGKSVLSKMLAESINYSFYDTDSIIEDKEKIKISEIFFKYGEEYFRETETKLLKSLSELREAVISTGGGIVLREKNKDIIKESGICIFIDRNPDILIDNIDPSERPLLAKDKNKLFELSKSRDGLYRKTADIIFTHNAWENDIEKTFDIFFDYVKDKI